MFAFIRQEIARAAAATTTSPSPPSPHRLAGKNDASGRSSGGRVSVDGGFPGSNPGGGGGGDEGALLSGKRDVVLSKLPQLMELNKVRHNSSLVFFVTRTPLGTLPPPGE